MQIRRVRMLALGVAYHTKIRINHILAYFWRFLLFRTRVIAITGSVGKSTTKEMLSAILSAQGPTVSTIGNLNNIKHGGIAKTLLRTMPWYRFTVIEAGISDPGMMKVIARLVRPDIAVILTVNRCHAHTMRDLETTAREKAGLLAHLKPHQLAILNRDDPRVAAMGEGRQFQVQTFGSSPDCDVWAADVTSRWPERLSLTVHVGSESYPIHTLLVGTHWVPSILASLTVAQACGIAIAEAISKIEKMEPFWARLQPVQHRSGAVILRDEYNGNIDTLESAFSAFKEAVAERKVLILGDYSGTAERSRARFRQLGQWGAELADVLVVVGESSHRSVKAAVAAGMDPEKVHGFYRMEDVTGFLQRELRAGDLAMIKGRSSDHLARIYLGLLGDVTCRKVDCKRQILCDRCEQLGFSWTPAVKGLMAPSDSRV